MKPLVVSEALHEMVDAFCACIMGIGAVQRPEYRLAMQNYRFIPLESTVDEDANIDVQTYLKMLSTDDLSSSITPFGTKVVKSICQNCCISAYETINRLPNYPELSKEPVIQFLRHVRNACAHGNMFNFAKGQPDKSAAWRGKRIDKSLQNQNCFFGLLAPGDIPHLLGDLSRMIK